MASAARRARRRDPAAQRRRSQCVGAVGVLIAAVLPVYLWHDVVADIARVSAFDMTLVVGWMPWLLMSLGLLCCVPMVLVRLREGPERRFHRPGSGAWVGWGVSLYVLGFGLATQVAQIHGLHS